MSASPGSLDLHHIPQPQAELPLSALPNQNFLLRHGLCTFASLALGPDKRVAQCWPIAQPITSISANVKCKKQRGPHALSHSKCLRWNPLQRENPRKKAALHQWYIRKGGGESKAGRGRGEEGGGGGVTPGKDTIFRTNREGC